MFLPMKLVGEERRYFPIQRCGWLNSLLKVHDSDLLPMINGEKLAVYFVEPKRYLLRI